MMINSVITGFIDCDKCWRIKWVHLLFAIDAKFVIRRCSILLLLLPNELSFIIMNNKVYYLFFPSLFNMAFKLERSRFSQPSHLSVDLILNIFFINNFTQDEFTYFSLLVSPVMSIKNKELSFILIILHIVRKSNVWTEI